VSWPAWKRFVTELTGLSPSRLEGVILIVLYVIIATCIFFYSGKCSSRAAVQMRVTDFVSQAQKRSCPTELDACS
jgi:hypothetical protein